MFRVVGNNYKISRKLLEGVAQASFCFLKLDNVELELKYVSIAEITRLNNIYRDMNEPTDVLSFVIEEKPLIGQIFICYNLAKKQADKMEKTIDNEVALLLVHSILHLVGYDHKVSSGARIMETLEQDILGKVGIVR
jgi:probable rRNA maturation factor